MRKLPRYALAGFAVMVISEVGMLFGVEPFASFHTPIAWTGYILFVDGLVWRWRADSWLQSAPAEFLFLAVFSVPLWLVFEFYNLWIQNWHYVGLPENPWVRLLGYGWSFATIWPAIFETGELVSAFRDHRAPPKRRVERPCPSSLTGWQWASMAVGVVLLVWPLAWPSPYLAAPVFLGFIFLLDPDQRAARRAHAVLRFRVRAAPASGESGGRRARVWCTVGVLELLGAEQVGVLRAHPVRLEALRDAVAGLPRVPGVRARVLHDVRDRAVSALAWGDTDDLDIGAGMTATTIEREVKIPFASADEARTAILAIGASPLHGRRLQEDCLLDDENETLRRRRCVLRVRTEAGKSRLTFKGPVQPATVKAREELETVVGDGTVLQRVFEELGLHVWFRYQKYREEFALEDVILAVDETPVGVFVEIEGSEAGIAAAAQAIGRGPDDYVLDSYRAVYLKRRESFGLEGPDMLFDEP